MASFLKFVHRVIPKPVADAIRPAYHFLLAILGEALYRFPGRQLNVIGVTGTNGKSTTANMIAHVLEADGHRVGLITTVNFQIGDKKWSNQSKMTSFGRFGTYKLLRQMVKAGCTHAVVEVSSHALHQHRAWGVPFQTAVFTNLTRDHLDYHRTMEEYRNTKGKLFQALARGRRPTTAVVNGDDPEAAYFLSFLADHKYVYGLNEEASSIMPLAHSITASDVRSTASSSSFEVQTETATARADLPMPGRFNVSNALAAVAVGLAHEVTLKKIVAALATFPGVPGRMEKVKAGQPFSIIVDYAHTPDAFEKVLSSLRTGTPGQIITVFGATGDRDRGKRPDLGRIAATHSDYLFLTEEDPGSEDPLAIIQEILPGIEAAGKNEHHYTIEPDRRAAIRGALQRATEHDIVVLLAIGHQTVMVRADGKHQWDDRVVAREEWQALSKPAAS